MAKKESQYSPVVGFIFVFNVIVGTGVLTLPGALRKAGWFLGLLVLATLGLSSYVSMTFIVESTAVANALKKLKKQQNPGEAHGDSDSEDEPQAGAAGPPTLYSLKARKEMGNLGKVLFKRFGSAVTFICIIAYMYGTLSVFTTLLGKTVMGVACTFRSENLTCKEVMKNEDPCWEGNSITRMNAYRMFATMFVLLLGPFGFFNVQTTTILQIATTTVRWFCFTFMVFYSIQKLAREGQQGYPPFFEYRGTPVLFGVSVYAYMCHHAIPALINPIRDKSKVMYVLAADCVVVMMFYILVAETGTFAFFHVFDLYSLNFNPRGGGDCSQVTGLVMTFFGYILTLFPVFTVGSNYPVDIIVLRNNLMVLFLKEDKAYHWLLRRIAFPLFAIIPPYVASLITNDLQLLVGFVGSYAGAGIQFFLPAAFVIVARNKSTTVLDPNMVNPYRSPFRHKAWPIGLIVFAIFCVVIVTINNITKFI